MGVEPTGVQAVAAVAELHERRRRSGDGARASRRRALERANEQLKRTQRLSWIGFAVLTFALCAWALRATSRERAAESLRLQQRGELLQLQRELDAARAEIAVLVAGRIPGLHALAFDSVIPIGNAYVRNASFTRVEEAGVAQYEYKLVLANESDVMVQPLLDLVIFDRVGVEIGRARIGGAEPDEKALFPGASRSYAGALALLPDSEPAWFRSQIH
jgi:hypothetical protein